MSSWPGRCAVSIRCPPLRTSTPRPCQPGSAPGPPPASSEGRDRRGCARARQGACRIECRGRLGAVPLPRAWSAGVSPRGPWQGPSSVCWRPSAWRRGARRPVSLAGAFSHNERSGAGAVLPHRGHKSGRPPFGVRRAARSRLLRRPLSRVDSNSERDVEIGLSIGLLRSFTRH